jgi:hypothetical protein
LVTGGTNGFASITHISSEFFKDGDALWQFELRVAEGLPPSRLAARGIVRRSSLGVLEKLERLYVERRKMGSAACSDERPNPHP